MRKLLIIIIFSLIGITLSAQTPSGQINVEKRIEDIDDSITIHRSLLDANKDSIANLRTTISSLQDVTAPTFSSAETNETGDSIIITFSESIDASYVPSVSDDAFIISINHFSSTEIDSITASGQYIYLSLNDTIVQSDVLNLSYNTLSDNYIRDLSGNALATFNNEVVTNNVEELISLISFYDFENNAQDSKGSYDGTASSGFYYPTALALSGNYKASFFSTSYIDVNNFPFSNSFTFAVGLQVWGVDYVGTIFATDTTEFLLDAPNRQFHFICAGDTASSNDSIFVPGAGSNMVILTVDSTTNDVRFIINGIDQTEDSTANLAVNWTQDTLRFGLNLSDTLTLSGYLDGARIYSDVISEATSNDLLSAYIGEAAIIDVIPPTIDTASFNRDGDNKIRINANEQLISSITPDTAAWKAYEGASEKEVTNPVIDGNVILFTCASASSPDSIVYAKSGNNNVVDMQYNELQDVSLSLVSYGSDTVETLAHYKAENNVLDDLDNYNGTASAALGYTTNAVAAGTYAWQMWGTDRYFEINLGSDVDTVFSVSFWVTEKDAYTRSTVFSSDSINIYINFSTNTVYLETKDGTTLTAASNTGVVFVTDAMSHVVVNKYADSVNFYVDNIYEGSSTDFHSGVTLAGVTRIGQQKDGTDDINAYLDEVLIMNQTLSSANVAELYSNPGSILSGSSTTYEPPVYDNPDKSQYTIILEQDWEDHSTGKWTKSQYQQDFPGGTGRSVDYRDPSTSEYNASYVSSLANTYYKYPETSPLPYTVGYFDSITIDSNYGSKVLEYNTVEGGVTNLIGGDEWNMPIGPYEEVWMTYNIKHKPGFLFNRGGKMFAGVHAGGDKTISMQPTYDEGASLRVMYKPVTGDPDRGQLYFYMYYQNSGRTQWGAGDFCYQFNGRAYLEPGQWQNITLRYVMNTYNADNSVNQDGFMEVFVDGVLHGRYSGMEILSSYYRTTRPDQWGINTFRGDVFFGGNSLGAPYDGGEDESAQRDEWWQIDDIAVFQWKQEAQGKNGVPLAGEFSDPNQVLSHAWMNKDE